MQYVESENKEKIEALMEIVNAHLDGIVCKTVVDIMKHLTEEKWAINLTLLLHTMKNSIYKVEREQQIGEFVGNNADVHYIDYVNDIEGGYKLPLEEL